jgi:type III polyketide synthase
VSDDEVHIGPTLFGDGAGALILSNEIEIQPTESRSLWKILNVQSTTLEDSAGCLEFNVHAHGMIFLLSASLVSRRTSTLTTKQAITL